MKTPLSPLSLLRKQQSIQPCCIKAHLVSLGWFALRSRKTKDSNEPYSLFLRPECACFAGLGRNRETDLHEVGV